MLLAEALSGATVSAHSGWMSGSVRCDHGAARVYWQAGEAALVSAAGTLLSPQHRHLTVAMLSLAALAAAAGRTAASSVAAQSSASAAARQCDQLPSVLAAAGPSAATITDGSEQQPEPPGDTQSDEIALRDRLAQENAELRAEVELLRASVDSGLQNLVALEEAVERGREQLRRETTAE